MLDDLNFISGKDPHGALQAAAAQPAQAAWAAQLKNAPDETAGVIEKVIVAGVGGSALAADVAKSWLRLKLPFEVVRKYELPAYVDEKTLVIVSSYSGNTEETVSMLEAAEDSRAQVVVIASGGQLIDVAQEKNYPFVQLPANYQPHMAVLLSLRAMTKTLESYLKLNGKYDEIGELADWLSEQSQAWLPEVATHENFAKQLAETTAGKTVVIYSGSRMAPVGYKWKVSLNKIAKNLAFASELPEASHNEVMGWTSHPVDKPFAVFDLISGFEYPHILKQFAISDQLLSGLRPKSTHIELQGESVLAQLLWGYLLADFVSIYLAILNGVDPMLIELIEKFKRELA